MMVDAPRSGHPIEFLSAHRVAVAWILLGLAAALVRLIVLDRQPLSEAEARYALHAWQALLGRFDGSLAEGGSPLLSYATVVVFGLFGASDVATRLVPALVGVGLSVSPGLLTGIFGLRTTLWAGVLIAFSPVAIYASRVVDPAIYIAALGMLTVASAIRLATDRPWWSPWALALGAGLSLAAGGGAVLIIAAALLAAVVVFARVSHEAGSLPWRIRLSGLSSDAQAVAREAVGPAILFVGAALLASTGALMDLRGIGFAFADVWGQALGLLARDSFPTLNLASILAYSWPLLALALLGFVLELPTRNFASILAYSWPLLALALLGYVLVNREGRAPRPRERRGRRLAEEDGETPDPEGIGGSRRVHNRLVSLVALWALIMLVVAAVAGADQLALVVAPIAPLALLGGTALARLPLDPREYELSGEGWTTLAVAATLVTVAIVIFSQNLAGSRPVAIVAWVVLVGLVVLLATGWRTLGSRERLVVATVVGGIAFVVVTASAISRASFGGSPPGVELLARDETPPAFRTLFRELTILANTDPNRSLVVDLPAPFAARWYGRAIPSQSGEQRASARPFVLREAPAASGPGPTDLTRVPWRVTSEIEPADVYPLGILRWLVSRSTLVHGRPHDIIVTR